MVLGILRRVDKWLLTSLVILAPYLSIEADELDKVDVLLTTENLSTSLLESRNILFPLIRNRSELYHETVEAFERLTIDSHDFALSFLWPREGSPTYPLSILSTDTQNLVILLNRLDHHLEPSYLELLLSNYLTAFQNYIFALSDSCTVPSNLNELASEWRRSAITFANYLSSSIGEDSPKAQELQRVILGWVEAQITDFNNAAPLCPDRTSPVNITAASAAYAQSRVFAYLLSVQIFELLSASRHDK